MGARVTRARDPWRSALRAAVCTCAAIVSGACDSGVEVGPPDTLFSPAFVYCTDRTGAFELIERQSDGTESPLTDDAAVDSWWPRISPSGETILYYNSDVADRPPTGAGNNNYAAASLWSYSVPNGTSTELIAQGANGWTAQGVADWSADGTKLVMAAQSTPDGGRWHLFVTAPDGSNPMRVSTRTSLYLDPSWSPDGERIVCAAFPPDYMGIDLSRLEIYTMNADGTDELRLTNDLFRDHDPYYAPSGNEIAFETDIDPTFNGIGRWALRAVTANGATLRTVLEDAQINTLPQWSPSGNTIYFQRFVFGDAFGFRLASIPAAGGATGDVQYLTEGGAYDDTDIVLLPGTAGVYLFDPRRWDEAIDDAVQGVIVGTPTDAATGSAESVR